MNLQTLYTAGETRKNLLSSLTLFLVSVPLCLGIAHASGMPLISGLISGMIGGLVVALISGSALSVSGPTASMTAFVFGAIAALGSIQAFLVATVLAGIFQIALGLFNAGAIAKFFPAPVVKGMLAAIGLILIFKQLPHLLGYDAELLGVMDFSVNPEGTSDFYKDTGGHFNTLTMIKEAFYHLHFGGMTIGLLSLAMLIVWNYRFSKRYPALPIGLIVILASVLLEEALFDYLGDGWALNDAHQVDIPILRDMQSFFAGIPQPDWSALKSWITWRTGLLIALVASIESLLSIEAIDRLDPYHRKTPESRELIAQGTGNILAGFLGALPVASIIIRGSVNIAAGATQKLSAILHGFWIVIALLLIPTWINEIPLATLAALLVFTGAKLTPISLWKDFWGRGWKQFVPFGITVASVFLTDLASGAFIGIFVSAGFILYNSYRFSAFRINDLGTRKRIILGRNTSFFQKASLAEFFDDLPPGTTLEIDGSQAKHIDWDIIDVIQRFQEQAPRKGITLVVGAIKEFSKTKENYMAEQETLYLKLMKNNKEWVKEQTDRDPNFFKNQAQGQTPNFLFIGCSDSRVPIETITKTNPGEIFVHRNVANIVSLTDINLLSVIQYSVEVLNVRHIIVCGHYGCGGVRAAIGRKSLGLIDNWISAIKMSIRLNEAQLKHIEDPVAFERKAIELHVLQQARNLHTMSVIQDSQKKFGYPKIHGLVYDLETGHLKDLELNLDIKKDFNPVFAYE